MPLSLKSRSAPRMGGKAGRQMASISRDKTTGRRTIQFMDGDKRKSIRLGKVTAKQAESAKRFVEDLVGCKATGSPPKATTAEWIATVPGTIRSRLERVGLIERQERQECPTLADWVRIYIAGRSDVKPNTRRNLAQAEKSLIGFFGRAKQLGEITPGDAEDLRIHMKAEGLAEGTIRRRCKRARQFFTAAIKKELLAENPFADIKCGNYSNAERFYFVSREEAEAALDACGDVEWRALFALCRYGGVRCPSEVLRLRWGDVDWQRQRFTVHASKTEHHTGSGIRQVPIFPELLPHLRDCFERAEPGMEYVITRYRNTNANLRTQLGRIIKRAGLTPWQKLFQNCRSTRETELAEEFPMQVVCAWIGNSQPVAAKHYLQVTDEHYRKAVQNPVQHSTAQARTDSQDELGEREETAFCGPMRKDAAARKYRQPLNLPPRGLEPLSPG